MAIFSTTYRTRTANFTVTLFDADGTESVISTGDQVRVKIGNTGGTPILDLDSIAASSNGSTVTRLNPVDLHIDQADLALFSPGIYDIEIALVDSSAGDKILNIETGTFVVLRSQGGDIGIA